MNPLVRKYLENITHSCKAVIVAKLISFKCENLGAANVVMPRVLYTKVHYIFVQSIMCNLIVVSVHND